MCSLLEKAMEVCGPRSPEYLCGVFGMEKEGITGYVFSPMAVDDSLWNILQTLMKKRGGKEEQLMLLCRYRYVTIVRT